MRISMLRVAAVAAASCLTLPVGALHAQQATTPPASEPTPAPEAARLQALESAVRALTAENERLRQAAASPPAPAASPDPAAARAADLERQLAQARQEREAVEQRLAQAQEQRQAAEQRLAAVQEEVRRLGTERDAAAAQARQLTEDLAAARAEAGRTDEQARAANARAEQAATDLAAAREDLAAAERAAQQAARELAGRDEQVERLRADLLAARNDLGAAEGQLQSRTKEVEALTAAARELVAGQDASASQLAGLRRELADAQGSAARLQHAQAERDALANADDGVRERLFAAVREALGPSSAPTPEGDRLILPTDLAFRPASAVLEPPARARVVAIGRELAAAAESLQPGTDWLLQVEGHTDQTRVGGRVFSSNRALAAARAVTVAEALAEGGVPPERLAAVGFGEFQPLDTGGTPEALRRNRRIELRVIDG